MLSVPFSFYASTKWLLSFALSATKKIRVYAGTDLGTIITPSTASPSALACIFLKSSFW